MSEVHRRCGTYIPCQSSVPKSSPARKHSVAVRSSAEAEYKTMTSFSCELGFLNKLFKELIFGKLYK